MIDLIAEKHFQFLKQFEFQCFQTKNDKTEASTIYADFVSNVHNFCND